MRTYAVLLKEPNQAVSDKILELYEKPNFYQINETSYLICTNKLSGDIAAELGIYAGDDSDTGVPAVVVKLNSAHAGFYQSDLWEWFSIAEGRE